MSEPAVRNLIVISDTHVGCSLGLCHAGGAAMDDGGRYTPSHLQQVVWGYWEEFWGEWVPRVTHHEPFAVVHNGDVIDGVHHGATHQWTHNLGDQVEHAYQILAPVVEQCEGRYYQIRGTEAHVGQSGVEEERLAKRLGAIPNDIGQHARYELWVRLGPNLCHLLHHIGTTSSAQHEASAINAELTAMYAEAGRWQEEAPRVVVRSHRHRNAEIRLTSDHGYAVCFVTPAWQMRTPFAFKKAGARISQPQIGGSLIRLGDEELHTRHKVWKLTRSPEVVL